FSNRGVSVDANGNAFVKEIIAARTGDSRQVGINQLSAAGVNAAELTQRGGGSRVPLKDSYLLTSFQIHYIIPAKIKCPPIR
ncbi:MAG: hypothetical protein EOO39_21100, partial [Cytophagaceae bacterium]